MMLVMFVGVTQIQIHKSFSKIVWTCLDHWQKKISKAKCHMAKDCEPTVGNIGGGDGQRPVDSQAWADWTENMSIHFMDSCSQYALMILWSIAIIFYAYCKMLPLQKMYFITWGIPLWVGWINSLLIWAICIEKWPWLSKPSYGK